MTVKYEHMCNPKLVPNVNNSDVFCAISRFFTVTICACNRELWSVTVCLTLLDSGHKIVMQISEDEEVPSYYTEVQYSTIEVRPLQPKEDV